jgi:hypothetical protein
MVNATETCTKRRLFHAASQTYQPAMEVVGREVGWREPPIVVRRSLPGTGRPIDLALVGRVTDGVVVALRGSLPPFFGGYAEPSTVLLDWLNDAAAVSVRDPHYGGGVHLGFADSVRRLWRDEGGEPGLRTAIATVMARGERDRRSRRHLFVTGHSKGGALANLVAMRAAREAAWDDLPISVATIGAPRAGDAAFAHAYACTRIACLRYETAHDPVPQLPPARDGWVAVGERIAPAGGHRRWPGTRRRLPRLRGRRGLSLEALLPPMLTAHAICPDSAYDRLVCEGEPGCDHGHAAGPARGSWAA